MSERTEKSSIHLIFFYMQSKEMYKLTQQLCRVAKEEYHERKAELPDDVRDDISFDKILEMVEHIEKTEYAHAIELLGEAYKEYQEMLSYFPRLPSRGRNSKTPTIFGDQWEARVKPEALQKFTPTPRDSVPTVKYTVVGEGGDDTDTGDSTVRFPEDRELNYSFRPNYLSKLSPKEEKEFVFGSISNSPTVLTERFGELFEKEWSVAFKELSKIIGEKAAVRHLLWIIAKASNVCATMATEQLADLENSSIGILVSRDPLNKMCTCGKILDPVKMKTFWPFVMKLAKMIGCEKTLLQEALSAKDERLVLRARYRLISYRRDIAQLSIPILHREIRRAIVSELSNSLPRKFTCSGNSFIEYAEKCIELVWLMYVHDPPMHLEWLTKDQEGKAFQADLYKTFTRSGTLFDYCVWPLVRLRREGPLLAKGIAQAR